MQNKNGATVKNTEKTFDEIMTTRRQELEKSLTFDEKIELFYQDADEVRRVFVPGVPVTFYSEGQWYWGVLKSANVHPLYVEAFIVTGESEDLLTRYMFHKAKYVKIERKEGEALITTLKDYLKNSWTTKDLVNPHLGKGHTRIGQK